MKDYWKRFCCLCLICSLLVAGAVTLSMALNGADEAKAKEEPIVITEPIEEVAEELPEVVEPINITEIYSVEPLPTLPIDEPVQLAAVIEKPNPADVELLACAIYQEVGSDACCDECRYRVADVILNRVADNRFPDSINGVLTAKRQYGRFYWTGVVWPDRAANIGEKHAVERAYDIAEDVLLGTHSELFGNGYVFQAEFKQGNDSLSRIYCERCQMWYCK